MVWTRILYLNHTTSNQPMLFTTRNMFFIIWTVCSSMNDCTVYIARSHWISCGDIDVTNLDSFSNDVGLSHQWRALISAGGDLQLLCSSQTIAETACTEMAPTSRQTIERNKVGYKEWIETMYFIGTVRGTPEWLAWKTPNGWPTDTFADLYYTLYT